MRSLGANMPFPSPRGGALKHMLLAILLSSGLWGCLSSEAHAQTSLQKDTLSVAKESESYANTQDIINHIADKDESLPLRERMDKFIVLPRLKEFIRKYNRPFPGVDRILLQKEVYQDVGLIEVCMQNSLLLLLAKYDIVFFPELVGDDLIQPFHKGKDISINNDVQELIHRYEVYKPIIVQYHDPFNTQNVAYSANIVTGELIVIINYPFDKSIPKSILINEIAWQYVMKTVSSQGLRESADFLIPLDSIDEAEKKSSQAEYLTDLLSLAENYDDFIDHIIDYNGEAILFTLGSGYNEFKKNPFMAYGIIYETCSASINNQKKYILSKTRIFEMIIRSIQENGQDQYSRENIRQHIEWLQSHGTKKDLFLYFISILKDTPIKDGLLHQVIVELEVNGLY